MSKTTIISHRTLNGRSVNPVSSSVRVSNRQLLSSSVEIPRTVTKLQDPLAGDVDRDKLFQVWPMRSAHVITEMLITEKGYIESLHEVIIGYLKPLYEYLFSASQGAKFIKTVFCNIQKLHNIHVDFFKSLISSYENPSFFGKVFVRNVNNFQEYTHYCTNFPKCEELLQHVMKSEPATRDFIIQCQLNIGHLLPLITYLHKPVQRILKYKLLLEQILKGMSENMQGFTEIKEALQSVISVTMEINEVKRKNENLQRVENIQKSLKGLESAGLCGGDLRSCGNLVFEERCKVLGRRGGERTMILFQSCLLFLKTKGSHGYIYKGHILVEELDLCDVSSVPNAFKVFSVYRPSRTLTVEVRSSALKERVVNQIQSVLVTDLKEQKSLRENQSKSEKEHGDREEEKRDSQSTIVFNLAHKKVAHKKSLHASELQSRRISRQLSTRKWLNTPDDTSYEEFSSSNIPVQANHKSVSRDSGIDNTSSLSIDIKEEECEEQTTSEKGREEQTWRKFEASDKRLKRRTAIRRKETSKGYQTRRMSVEVARVKESPATVSYSYQLGSEITWSAEFTSSSESFETSLSSIESSQKSLESSLDKNGLLRQDLDTNAESSLTRGGGRFVQSKSLDENLFSDRDSRPHSDAHLAPHDPEVLFEISVDPPVKEYEESNMMPVTNITPLEDPTLHNEGATDNHHLTLTRIRVSSRDSELSGDSLCSNASSLTAEDHYYLSTMSKSSIIAGKDGENITIYDEDSDDSEDEFENEETEPERRVCDKEEGDMVERSLRSCLSRAKLWGSQNEDERVISPLATLPRSSSSALFSKLPKEKAKIKHRKTFDTMRSLPIDMLKTGNGIDIESASPPMNRSASMDELQVDEENSFPKLQITPVPGTEGMHQINTSELQAELGSPISNTPITYEIWSEIERFEDQESTTIEDNETSMLPLEDYSQSQEFHHPLGNTTLPFDFMNLDELISLANEVNHEKYNNQSPGAIPELLATTFEDHTTKVDEEFEQEPTETLASNQQSEPVISSNENLNESSQAASNSTNLHPVEGTNELEFQKEAIQKEGKSMSYLTPSVGLVPSATDKAVKTFTELNSLLQPDRSLGNDLETQKKSSKQPADSKHCDSEIAQYQRRVCSNSAASLSIQSPEKSHKQLEKRDKDGKSSSQTTSRGRLTYLEVVAVAGIMLGLLSMFSLCVSILISAAIGALLVIYIGKRSIASPPFDKENNR